jgi:hypothetical protein
MELREYLLIIKKYKKVFFGVWGSILFLALCAAMAQPTVYEGEITGLIIREGGVNGAEVSNEYDYRYQLEANDKIANILIGLLKDKALIERSFSSEIKGQKIPVALQEKKWISSRISGEEFGPGYISIKIKSHNKNLIKPFGERFIQQLKKKATIIGSDQNRLVNLQVEPIIISQKSKFYIPIGAGAFFAGLLVAIFVILSIYYWNGGKGEFNRNE